MAASGSTAACATSRGPPVGRPAPADRPGRLVARRPELWLLDEPHAGLDARRPRPGRRAGPPRPPRPAHGAARLPRARPGRDAGRADGRGRPVGRRPSAGRRTAGPPCEPDAVPDRITGRRGQVAPCSVTPLLVAGKDLRIEAPVAGRHQPGRCPFALLVLVLFAFALDPDRGVLDRATPGLFWVAVLFCGAARDPAGVRRRGGRRRPRRAAAVRASTRRASSSARRPASRSSCWRCEVVLGVGVVVLYGADSRGRPLLLVADLPGRDRGLAAAGTLYGVLAAGLRVRETLLPLLLLPVVAPVLIGATRRSRRLWASASGPAEGWPWVGLLAGVRPALHRLRTPRLRPPPGGVVTRTQRRPAHWRPGRSRPRRGTPACWRSRRHRPRVSWRSLLFGLAMLAVRCRPVTDARTMGDVGAHHVRPRPIGLASPTSPSASPPSARACTCGARRESRWDLLRRRLGRDRRVFTGAHPRHRHRSGAGRPGASTGPGTPASPAPRCCSCSSSATWPSGGCRPRPEVRAKRAAIVGLIAFVDVPIVHLSVDWWRVAPPGRHRRPARPERRARRHHAVHPVLRAVRLHPHLRLAAAPPPAAAVAGGPAGASGARPGHRRAARRGHAAPWSPAAGARS